MFQDMAVKHEGVGTRRRPIKGHEKFSFVLDQHRVFPTAQMRRRRLSLNGENSEQSAVDMEWMRHTDRGDFPDLGCSKLRLDIDARHVKRLAVYPDDGSHLGVAAGRLGTGGAQAAVKNQLPPLDGGGWVDRCRLDQARRQLFDRRSRSYRFEAHYGHVISAPVRRHPAENTHFLVGVRRQNISDIRFGNLREYLAHLV
jgi:hypothetical protein